MGQAKPVTFVVAIVLFLCVSLVVYTKPQGKVQVKERQLSSALSQIDNWQLIGKVALLPAVAESLQLDDYLYQNYRNGNQEVSLYIGYYLTTGKVGVAHDPLVCLPGQGWLVKHRDHGKLSLADGSGHSISYATMVVERNGQKELFLYWFQAYDKAVAGTFSQKITSLTNRLQGLGQDNAFVRLSCTMNNETEQQCRQILTGFIRDFYPLFLQYIQGEG